MELKKNERLESRKEQKVAMDENSTLKGKSEDSKKGVDSIIRWLVKGTKDGVFIRFSLWHAMFCLKEVCLLTGNDPDPKFPKSITKSSKVTQ